MPICGDGAGLGVCGGLLFSDRASSGDVLANGSTVVVVAVPGFGPTMEDSSCDVEEVDDVLLNTFCVIPESGDALLLGCGGPTSSMDRRVLSSSVEANATSRSNPELTRSCQCDSSSAPSSMLHELRNGGG